MAEEVSVVNSCGRNVLDGYLYFASVAYTSLDVGDAAACRRHVR